MGIWFAFRRKGGYISEIQASKTLSKVKLNHRYLLIGKFISSIYANLTSNTVASIQFQVAEVPSNLNFVF